MSTPDCLEKRQKTENMDMLKRQGEEIILRNIENKLLITLKPFNVYMDGERPSCLNMYQLLKRELSIPDGAYLTHCHQLDYPTSGILLFALDKKTASFISDAFASRKISKKYLALCDGDISVRWGDCRHPLLFQGSLGVDGSDPNEFKQSSDILHGEGKAPKSTRESITRAQLICVGEFQDMDSGNNCIDSTKSHTVSLVRLYPITGRTHQLRVHLSSIGFPIHSDQTYNSNVRHSSGNIPRLKLHAQSIKFPFGNESCTEITTENPFLPFIKKPYSEFSNWDPLWEKIWRRRKFAALMPYFKDIDGKIWLLLGFSTRRKLNGSRRKGMWHSILSKELHLRDVDTASAACSAFIQNCMDYECGNFLCANPKLIRSGHGSQICVIPLEDPLVPPLTYPNLKTCQTTLFISPLKKNGSLGDIQEWVRQVNLKIDLNSKKSGKDPTHVSNVDIRSLELISLDDCLKVTDNLEMDSAESVTINPTMLYLDPWLQCCLRNLKLRSILKSFQSLNVIEFPELNTDGIFCEYETKSEFKLVELSSP